MSFTDPPFVLQILRGRFMILYPTFLRTNELQRYFIWNPSRHCYLNLTIIGNVNAQSSIAAFFLQCNRTNVGYFYAFNRHQRMKIFRLAESTRPRWLELGTKLTSPGLISLSVAVLARMRLRTQ